MVYSYDYYKDIDKDINNSLRALYLKKKAKNYPFLFSFYVISLTLLLILYSNVDLILLIIMMILGGFMYNLWLKDLTKKIPLFKNVYTATTWSLGGAFFPLFYYSLDISLSFIVVFIFIFMRIMINVIYFDLKDIENDKSSAIKTIPVMRGKKSTINILHFINIISFIPLILGVYLTIINVYAISLLIFFFYGYFYINKANSVSKNELESVAHTLADSEFIFWPVVLTISTILI